MGTRGLNRAGAAAAAGLAGIALLAVGTATPALADDGATQGTKPGTQPGTQTDSKPVTKPATKPAPKPEPDVTAPQRPALGEAITEAGGAVHVDVQAEAGSALVVREGAKVVASATAVGGSQTLAWRTKSGPHTYFVVATDAAGNASDGAALDVEVDATPPSVEKFSLTAGKSHDSRSRWSAVTDPGTAWTLLVDGKTVADGTAKTSRLGDYLDLADGAHDVRLELRDSVGNLRVAEDTLRVDVPVLWVAAKAVSDAGDAEQVFKVAAPPMTRGYFRIPGVGGQRFDLTSGRAEVTMEVPEGSYDAPVVTVADSNDRKGTTSLDPFEVDLTAPAVQIDVVKGSAQRGQLDATITAGEGDAITWKIVNEDDFAVMSGQFTGDGTAQRLQRDVAEGSYTLEVTAVDANGNESAESADAVVAANPLVNPDAVPAIAIALLLWVLFGLVFLLRRRGRGIGAFLGRFVGTLQSPRSRRAQVAAERARVEQEYAVELAAFETENAAWQHRHDALNQLLTLAAGGRVETPETGIELDTGERVFCVVPATLLDADMAEVEDGRLVVTGSRIAYVGETRRDWQLSDLQQLRHIGTDRTVLKGAGAEPTAVAYADGELVRLYLELATAARSGSTRSVRIMLEQGLRSHDLRRPQAPAPVGGVEVAPVAEPVPAREVLVERPVVEAATGLQAANGQPPVIAQQPTGTDRELALLDS